MKTVEFTVIFSAQVSNELAQRLLNNHEDVAMKVELPKVEVMDGGEKLPIILTSHETTGVQVWE